MNMLSLCVLQSHCYVSSRMILIVEFAVIIKKLVGGNNTIVLMAAVEDDPQRRKPDISRAKIYLNWEPKVL